MVSFDKGVDTIKTASEAGLFRGAKHESVKVAWRTATDAALLEYAHRLFASVGREIKCQYAFEACGTL